MVFGVCMRKKEVCFTDVFASITREFFNISTVRKTNAFKNRFKLLEILHRQKINLEYNTVLSQEYRKSYLFLIGIPS